MRFSEMSAQTRDDIREKLRTFMAGPPRKGPVAIASDIKRVGQTISENYPIEAPSHETVKRFINDEGITLPKFIEAFYVYLVYRKVMFDPDYRFPDRPDADRVSWLIHHFFSVRPHNRGFCHSLVGLYSLYFRSEDINRHVVRAAMSFSFDEAKDAFEVTETQKRQNSGAVELWSGYYFARRNKPIIILRGEGEFLDNMPKFYILKEPQRDEQHATEAGGMAIKIGSGARGGVFATKVLLRRDPEALAKCDVVHDREIPEDILDEI
jgi:hypothetical protein